MNEDLTPEHRAAIREAIEVAAALVRAEQRNASPEVLALLREKSREAEAEVARWTA